MAKSSRESHKQRLALHQARQNEKPQNQIPADPQSKRSIKKAQHQQIKKDAKRRQRENRNRRQEEKRDSERTQTSGQLRDLDQSEIIMDDVQNFIESDESQIEEAEMLDEGAEMLIEEATDDAESDVDESAKEDPSWSTQYIAELLDLDLVGTEILKMDMAKLALLCEDPETCIEARKGSYDVAFARILIRYGHECLSQQLNHYIARPQDNKCVRGLAIHLNLFCSLNSSTPECVCYRPGRHKAHLHRKNHIKLYKAVEYAKAGNFEAMLAVLFVTDQRGRHLEASHMCSAPSSLHCATFGHSELETSSRNRARVRHTHGTEECDCRIKCPETQAMVIARAARNSERLNSGQYSAESDALINIVAKMKQKHQEMHDLLHQHQNI